MVERATLKLDDGDEIRVEVDRDDLANERITITRAAAGESAGEPTLPDVARSLLDEGDRHPAGTTDRLIAADRDRSV